MNSKTSKKISRRGFISTSATAVAGLTIIPKHAVSGLGHKAPSDKLNIAVIGIGGMGSANLKAVAPTENIVALCDVDWRYAKGVFAEHPNAKPYWDWRKMYDEMAVSIDAVIVATADHSHCIAAANAITIGKHAYVQKPLTHSVYESRLLTRLAAKYKVATQMGNQRSSGEAVNLTTEWIQNGEIGEVRKVEAFTDRPLWPQGQNVPKGEWVPDTLNWDLFVGPARMRPYSSLYTPWNWRGWSLRESYKPPTPYIQSSPGHYMEWIVACKGGEPAGANFDWAGPLTETVLLGNVPLRKELREKLNGLTLKFDPEKLSFPNLPEADQFVHYEYRNGWSL